MADKVKAGQDAERSLSRYYEELRKRRKFTLVSSLVLAVCVGIFVMIVSGERFRRTLDTLGIEGFDYSFKGVYADCSDPKNANNAICQKPAWEAEKTWKTVKSRRVPFKLSE